MKADKIMSKGMRKANVIIKLHLRLRPLSFNKMASAAYALCMCARVCCKNIYVTAAQPLVLAVFFSVQRAPPHNRTIYNIIASAISFAHADSPSLSFSLSLCLSSTSVCHCCSCAYIYAWQCLNLFIIQLNI